ncbi:hypothetical protein SAMN05216480_10245 [Pustulibacterium marinum]|uniref:Uncharacterized protein n=1 Tax=Pustulibacterium marinum TaxID=1224947 RepID=A0A1I7FMV0_9FLAO|nr:hypothetical protein [Pustulibacterium marinum]SFU37547.1 hypothetical protein SAMN05216480_10245 [Pustulibacterium marinum]
MNRKQYIATRALFDEDDLTIVGILWDDENLSNVEKLNLSFDFFERSPEYGICSELNMYFSELTSEEKNTLLDYYKKYLKSDKPEHKKQIKYSLWVDFFEDPQTVAETWNSLIGDCKDEHILRELLSVSGPVPFDKKDELYLKLIKDKTNHEAILDSLVGSFFDVYGDINMQRARVILPTLKIDKTSEKYIKLNKKLKEFQSKEEYWKSLEGKGN